MTHQMSDFLPWPVSLTTSGAIQYGVPFIDLRISDWPMLRLMHSRFAHPKSISLMTALGISITLPPLMSLKQQQHTCDYWVCQGQIKTVNVISRQGDFILCQGDLISCQGDFILCQGDFISCQGDFISCQGDFILCQGDFISCQGNFTSYTKNAVHLTTCYQAV